MGSGNCRLRRKKAQMYAAASKVRINEERKDGLPCNKLTCILNDYVGIRFFRSISSSFPLRALLIHFLKTDRLKNKTLLNMLKYVASLMLVKFKFTNSRAWINTGDGGDFSLFSKQSMLTVLLVNGDVAFPSFSLEFSLSNQRLI